MPPPFHLAFPVDDLAEARRFYGELLGCPEGRSSERWIDFDLRGHQIVAHFAPEAVRARASNPVDGQEVPVPHFGLVLAMSVLGERLEFSQIVGAVLVLAAIGLATVARSTRTASRRSSPPGSAPPTRS